MQNKILIAGGAGFIGTNLCKRLIKDGHQVLSIDNYYTGHKNNLADLLQNSQFKAIEHNIIEPWFDEIEIDTIYNLACPASPKHYQADPIYTLKTNFLGSLNLLELAKYAKAKILLASTSEIYGDPIKHPQNESYFGNVNPNGIRACYDEGKRCAETLFFDYHRQFQTQIKVARIFNTYGSYMHPNDGRVVSNFIIQALTGKAITIYGNGKQTRSFCYIDDLLEGLILLMQSKDNLIGPINLGNPHEITVLELAEKIFQLIGKKTNIQFLELPQDDPTRRKPDISKATTELGWIPKVLLEDGLKETITYFKKHIA